MGSMETYLEDVALVAARDIVVFDANDLACEKAVLVCDGRR